jgi:hypothetical protein
MTDCKSARSGKIQIMEDSLYGIFGNPIINSLANDTQSIEFESCNALSFSVFLFYMFFLNNFRLLYCLSCFHLTCYNDAAVHICMQEHTTAVYDTAVCRSIPLLCMIQQYGAVSSETEYFFICFSAG